MYKRAGFLTFVFVHVQLTDTGLMLSGAHAQVSQTLRPAGPDEAPAAPPRDWAPAAPYRAKNVTVNSRNLRRVVILDSARLLYHAYCGATADPNMPCRGARKTIIISRAVCVVCFQSITGTPPSTLPRVSGHQLSFDGLRREGREGKNFRRLGRTTHARPQISGKNVVKFDRKFKFFCSTTARRARRTRLGTVRAEDYDYNNIRRADVRVSRVGLVTLFGILL